MKKFRLFTMLLVLLATAIGMSSCTEEDDDRYDGPLLGTWFIDVTESGEEYAGQYYTFRDDWTYEYYWDEKEYGEDEIWRSESGTFSVSGDYITLDSDSESWDFGYGDSGWNEDFYNSFTDYYYVDRGSLYFDYEYYTWQY